MFDRAAHDHMVCDRCGRYIECRDAGIEARIEDICKTNGFSKRIYRLVVFGICEQCEP